MGGKSCIVMLVLYTKSMTTTEAQIRNSIRIARKEMNEPCPAYRARCAAYIQELEAELAKIGRAA